MSISAMKQALEALDCINSPLHVREMRKLGEAMRTLRQAIAEAEKQEQWSCPHGIEDGACKQCYEDQTKPKMRRATRKEKIVNPGVYEVPVHASDISQERVDETEKDRHEYWCASLTQLLLCDPPKRAPCDCKPPKPSETKPAKEECWACGCFRCVCDKSVPKPKREWVGLSHEERDEIDQTCRSQMQALFAIEAKLKEKNCG